MSCIFIFLSMCIFRVMVTDEWTPESGMVTAAFKIRRRQIVDHYKNEIQKIYV